MTNRALPPVTLVAQHWGEQAASRLDVHWLARVWEADAQGVVLVDQEGEIIRLVTEAIGNGPFHIVLPDADAIAWESLPRSLYAWRVGSALWFGDSLTLHLPSAPPWQSALSWEPSRAPHAVEALARHLAWLADWLLARAPEGTIASLLPDLITAGNATERAVQRDDLPLSTRLFGWRSARILDSLLPALAMGDLATAESIVHSLAGLGPGTPPAGDWFMLGLMAGIPLYPAFLAEGSGLRPTSLLQRLVRGMAERTSLLGRAYLLTAMEGQWAERWHTLHAALTATEGYPDTLRDKVTDLAAAWLAQDESAAGSALAGVVLPFLWHQRFL